MLLTLENNYSRWLQEAIFVANGEGEKPKLPDALYTNSGNSRVKGKGTSRRFHGWSKQGYLRFNELYCQVKRDRIARAQFELEVLESCRETHSGDHGEDSTDDSDDEEIIATMGGAIAFASAYQQSQHASDYLNNMDQNGCDKNLIIRERILPSYWITCTLMLFMVQNLN